MAGLSKKQAKFVDEYLVDLNASQAALRAGYSPKTAFRAGQVNMQKYAVKTAIEKALAKRAKRVEIKADDVIQQLIRMGLADPRRLFHADGSVKAPHELDDDIAHAIQGIETTTTTDKDGNVRVTHKYKLSSREKSLELIGRHLGKRLGAWTDKTEHDIASDSPLASLVAAINDNRSTLKPHDDNA